MDVPHVAEIPLIHMDSSDAFALVERTWPQTRELMRDVLTTHWAFPLAVKLAEGPSRRWLERRQNPYLPEIARIAKAVGRRGGYFFNIVYEWGCSTSVARDPAGEGARMIRVLDWELRGMAKHTVIAEQQTPVGPFYNLTWPGYAGVVTGMAPGRFAAAINQGPRFVAYKSFWLNEIAARWRMLHCGAAIPATHLLRRAFEAAANFEEAIAVLMKTDEAVATPAIFVVSGTSEHDGAIVEACGHERRVTRMNGAPLGIANNWISPDLHGVPHAPAREWAGAMTAEQDSAMRRAGICRMQDGPFGGAATLPPPMLNSRTVMVAEMNARTGHMRIEALESPKPGVLPHAVAGRIVSPS